MQRKAAFRRCRVPIMAAAAVGLAACSGINPMVDRSGINNLTYATDLRECNAYADEVAESRPGLDEVGAVENCLRGRGYKLLHSTGQGAG